MMMRFKQKIKRQNRPDSKYAWSSKQRKSNQKTTHPFSQTKRKSLIHNESRKKKKIKIKPPPSQPPESSSQQTPALSRPKSPSLCTRPHNQASS